MRESLLGSWGPQEVVKVPKIVVAMNVTLILQNRYITLIIFLIQGLEKNSGEIRQQYVYFGETKHMKRMNYQIYIPQKLSI